MDPEVLRSYMIKLGVQVDSAAFDKMKTVLNDLEKVMGKHASSVAMQMTKGAGLTVGAYAAVMTSIGKLIQKVSEADMSYQLLAQKMYMSADAVKAFKQATDTLGNSIDEIAWNAELKERYVTLVADIQKLKVPEDAKDMMKQVRGIGFEFDRLKLASKLTLEQVAYNLLRLNKGELSDMSKTFTGWVDRVYERIPQVAKRIADFLQPFIDVGASAIRFLKEFWDLLLPIRDGAGILADKFKEIWAIIPDIVKQALILSGVLAFFLLGSPLAVGLAGIAAALLLIDDYMAFKEGRESLQALIPVWKTLEAVVYGVAAAIKIIGITISHISSAIRGEAHPSGKSLTEDIGDYASGVKERVLEKWKRRDEKAAESKKGPVMTGAAFEAAETGEPKSPFSGTKTTPVSEAPVTKTPLPAGTNVQRLREASLLKVMDEQGITDPKERAAFMAQVSHETGGFKKYSEGKYSAERVWALRGTRLAKQGVSLAQMKMAEGAKGKSAMYEYMYGGRMGNVAGSGDAEKYKGRGAFQLTGKANYEQYGRELGIDLVNNPELAEDPVIAAKIAALYWKKNKLGGYARAGNIEAVSAGINVGNVRATSKVVGMEDRKRRYQQYLAGGMPAAGKEDLDYMRGQTPGVSGPMEMAKAGVGDTNQTTVNIYAQTNDPDQLGKIAAKEVNRIMAKNDKTKNTKRRLAAGV